ncbi:hypothetical protein BDZ89DRAFT_489319 [Hymenopellis radicata]|nr:hypothetical protein BDZ89DRAFT_489319 [Hymenopellis radicata]
MYIPPAHTTMCRCATGELSSSARIAGLLMVEWCQITSSRCANSPMYPAAIAWQILGVADSMKRISFNEEGRGGVQPSGGEYSSCIDRKSTSVFSLTPFKWRCSMPGKHSTHIQIKSSTRGKSTCSNKTRVIGTEASNVLRECSHSQGDLLRAFSTLPNAVVVISSWITSIDLTLTRKGSIRAMLSARRERRGGNSMIRRRVWKLCAMWGELARSWRVRVRSSHVRSFFAGLNTEKRCRIVLARNDGETREHERRS